MIPIMLCEVEETVGYVLAYQVEIFVESERGDGAPVGDYSGPERVEMWDEERGGEREEKRG